MAKSNFIKADLDQMVFEDKEKRYGGFFLRRNYPLHLAIATAITGIFALASTFGPYLADKYDWFGAGDEAKERKSVRVEIKLEDLPPPPPVDEETPPPPPPPDLPPPQVKTVAFQIPEPTPEEDLDPDDDPTIVEVEELNEAPNIGLEDQEGDDFGVFTGEIDGEGEEFDVIVEKTPDPNEFIFAEQQPQPVNMDDIKKLIGYPQIARDAGIEGNVVVRVLVDKKGNYKDHRVINQVHPILSKAVQKELPKLRFTPAIQGGKPIQFWVNIPFNFKLID
ncbi:MAG: energy transducer TonB [Bacteroidota bacterium]